LLRRHPPSTLFPYTTLFRSAVKPLGGARILRGWDFGALSPAVVFAQSDIHGRKLIHGELVLQQVTLEQLIDAVRARTIELYGRQDRKSTRLNSSHVAISYAV